MATSKEERRRKAISMGSAPSILLSGSLTKRTRSMNRWVKRWWQLLDNGMLLYFKNDQRVKILGEIDVGQTCYDVRLGAQHCKVQFPRAVAPGRCFAVSVLKRTYYFFASTPEDAKQWAGHISNLSAVLNRRRVAWRQAPKPPDVAGSGAGSGSTASGEGVKLRARAKDHGGVPLRHSVAVTPQDTYKLDQELRDEPSDLPVFHRPHRTVPPPGLPPPQLLSLSQPPSSSTPVQPQLRRLHPRYRHGSLPSSLDQLSLYTYPHSNGNPGFSFSSSSNQAVRPSGANRSRVNNPGLQMTRVDSFGSGDGGRTGSQSSDVSTRERSRSEPEHHKSDSPLSQSHPGHRHSLPYPMVPPSYMQLGVELQRLQQREAVLRMRLAQMDEPPRPVSFGAYKPGSLPYLPRPPSLTNHHLSMPSPTTSASSSDFGSSTDPSPQIVRRRHGPAKGQASPSVLPKPILKRSGYTATTHLPAGRGEETDSASVELSTVIVQTSQNSSAPSAAGDEHSDSLPTATMDVSDLSSADAGDASQQSRSPTSPNQRSPRNKVTPIRDGRRRPPPPLPFHPPPPLPSTCRPPPPTIPLQNGSVSPRSPHSQGEHSNQTMKPAESESTSRDHTNKNQQQTVSSKELV